MSTSDNCGQGRDKGCSLAKTGSKAPTLVWLVMRLMVADQSFALTKQIETVRVDDSCCLSCVVRVRVQIRDPWKVGRFACDFPGWANGLEMLMFDVESTMQHHVNFQL